MSKFSSLLTSSDALSRRASQLEESAKLAQESLINQLKNEKAQLNLQIAAHMDLAPDSTTSTKPGTDNWNASSWVHTLQQYKEKIYSIDLALKIAEETYTDLFEADGNN